MADEAFLAPASAMVHSLGSHALGADVDVLLLHDGHLSDEGRSRLDRTADGAGVTLRYVPVPGARLDEFPSPGFHRSIWARVLLPELLPNTAKVLYLDADTIVTAPLVELWRTDLGTHLFGAVTNPIYSFLGDWPGTALGIKDPRRYFNSGVLLMNLDRLRREDSTQRLLDYARAHPENIWPDQDALNYVLGDQRLPLHPRWNAQTTLWDMRLDELPFHEAIAREARADPAIVHFIGPFKPWHHLCTHPYRSRYFEHLAATPWPPRAIEGRTLANRVLRHLPPIWVNRKIRAHQALQRNPWYRRLSAAGSGRR